MGKPDKNLSQDLIVIPLEITGIPASGVRSVSSLSVDMSKRGEKWIQ